MGLFKKKDKKSKTPYEAQATPSDPYLAPSTSSSSPYTQPSAATSQSGHGGLSPSPHPNPSPGPYGDALVKSGYTPSQPGSQSAYGGDRYGGGGGGGGGAGGYGGYGGLGAFDPNAPQDMRRRPSPSPQDRYGGASTMTRYGGGPPSGPPDRYGPVGAYRPPPNNALAKTGPSPQATSTALVNVEDEDEFNTGGSYRNLSSNAVGAFTGGPSYGNANNAVGAYTGGDIPQSEYTGLSAEEQEEEEINSTKQDIRFIKQQTVASSRNALMAAAQAEESGRDTLGRLGLQGDKIYTAENNLDMSSLQSRQASQGVRELNRLNNSMWSVVTVQNPFTKERRAIEREQRLLAQHREDRAVREDTRLNQYRSEKRIGAAFKNVNRVGPGQGDPKKERAKYQFEADSEDEVVEDEIEANTVALEGAAGRLNALARATGVEAESQNQRLEVIMGKSDKVDESVLTTRAMLDRVR